MSSIYQLHYANGSPVGPEATLSWTSSTSTWADEGTAEPAYLTKNSTTGATTTSVSGVVANDVIRGWKTNIANQRGEFVHPSGNLDVVGTTINEVGATYIGAGGYWECISTTVASGGTSTEGGENGSITYVNNVLTWTIDSSSHTATNYKLYRDSTEVMSTIGHTTGSVTTGTVSNPASGVWTLVFNAIPFASLTVGTGTGTFKKVFCNFW